MTAERNHAILSASAAHRWLYCTPSARLEQEEGANECSVYAEEGTAAHALAELKLSYTYGHISYYDYQKAYDEFKTTSEYAKYYNPEFEEFVDSFVDYVCSQTDGLKNFHIYFELRVNFSNVVPQGFGTSDVVIVDEEQIHIIDLKFGKGVPVSAINNPQLRLYGMGALNLFPNTKTIKMSINQPRLASCDSEVLTKKELLDWSFNFVKPRADEAIEGKGVFHASEDACRFCKLRGKCKVRADQQLAVAQKEFEIAEEKQFSVTALDEQQIANILEVAPLFIDWFKDVQSYALGQLMRGVKIPGFKLVEGRSNRVIIDENKVKETLISAGYREEELTKPAEILGLSKLETLVGKKKLQELCADYIVKPQGKLTLAPESDRRPEVSSLVAAQNEFAAFPVEED